MHPQQHAAIVIHGGAAKVYSQKGVEDKMVGVIAAARAGYAALTSGGSANTAIDAVEAAVRVMEDDTTFNAGTGASLTSEGLVECDASIMDGRTMDVGALCSVTRFKNPVSVSRVVLEKSDHCIFSGEGAHRWAAEQGVTLHDPKDLIHPKAQERLNKFKSFGNAINGVMNHKTNPQDLNNNPTATNGKLSDHDTVGAVALDLHGNLAAATSTGGITGKLPGRVGDTPLPGSGLWAENETAAISTTGHGEAIMRVNLARAAAVGQSKDVSLAESSRRAIKFMQDRVDGTGGLVGVNRQGEVCAEFNTEDMAWAYILIDRKSVV